jgi:hypothetical protein
VLRPPCEALGLQANAQRERIERQDLATTRVMRAVAEDGKNRGLFCVHLDTVPMWLASDDRREPPAP